MFRDILHKIKIFFCDDDIEKIDCGLEIDRDLNAAINIQSVGVDAAIRTQSSRVAGCVEASKME